MNRFNSYTSPSIILVHSFVSSRTRSTEEALKYDFNTITYPLISLKSLPLSQFQDHHLLILAFDSRLHIFSWSIIVRIYSSMNLLEGGYFLIEVDASQFSTISLFIKLIRLTFQCISYATFPASCAFLTN